MPKMSPSTVFFRVGDTSVTGSTPVIARVVTVVTVVTLTFIINVKYIYLYKNIIYIESYGVVGVIGVICCKFLDLNGIEY